MSMSLQTGTPSLEQVEALDGRIFATLTPAEVNVLDFYRTHGRKFGVTVSIINKADADELARARSQDQADSIMKKANSLVAVVLSAKGADETT